MNRFKHSIKRCIAYMIDWLLSSLLYHTFALLLYSIVTQSQDSSILFDKLTHVQSLIIIFILFVTYSFYFIVYPYKKGQAIGQKLLHLQIIAQKKLSLRHYVIRFLMMLLLEGFMFYPTFVCIQYIEVFHSSFMADILYKVTIITTMISILMFMITGNFLHDIISQSQVVNQRGE